MRAPDGGKDFAYLVRRIPRIVLRIPGKPLAAASRATPFLVLNLLVKAELKLCEAD